MPRLAIIADDLTGALDSAAPFAAAPGGVVVTSHPDALPQALARGAAVVAVSTRSREVAPAEAEAAVAAVLAALPAATRVFKKVDSRLKGNVAAELAPFAGAPMLVAPAIPEFGRMVVEGALTGFGVSAPIPVRPRLGGAAAHAMVPETRSHADMLEALAVAGEAAVLVGARGLAAALAEAMGLPPAPRFAAGDLPHPLAIVVGSTDPITEAQVEALGACAPGLAAVAAPAGHLPVPPAGPPADLTLLHTAPGDGPAEASAIVAARFAAGAVPWLQRVRGLVLTGGATAEAVFDALGLTVLDLNGEALPGMPLVAAGTFMAVTKSGGFGAPDALCRLAGLSEMAA